MDTPLTTLLDPAWWTVGRMIVAAIVVVLLIQFVKD